MLNELTILYVEDEEFIRENMVEALEMIVGNVYTAEDGEEAYSLYLDKRPDIIIADIEMPKLNGLKLAEKIRKQDKETQIVIATAYTNTDYFLKAVELNLVKYLIKPVTLIDLKNALMRSYENIMANKTPIRKLKDGYTYNFFQRALYYNKTEVKLTNYEMLFLEILLKNSKRVISYVELENHIWEEGASSSAIRSLIRDLRKKLPKGLIINIPKVGYKITC